MAKRRRTTKAAGAKQDGGTPRVAKKLPLGFIGLAIALAIIIVGGLIFLTGRQNISEADLSASRALVEGRAEGSPDAKVTMTEYSDFQ